MLASCKGPQSLFNQFSSEPDTPERGEDEREESDFIIPEIVCCAALDPWMRPVREDEPTRRVVKPLLIMNRCPDAQSFC